MAKEIYRHYGSHKMLDDLFEPIKNKDTPWIKPEGGLWASPTREDAYTWNQFLEYDWGRDVPDYFDFSLDKDARILYINSLEDLQKLPTLENNFPLSYWACLDFEALAKDYDAIEVNISKDSELRHALDGWDVDSLLVFHPDVVKMESSFIKYPELFKKLSEEYPIEPDYLSVQNGDVFYHDSNYFFILARIDKDGEIREKLSENDFWEEMTDVAKDRRAVRNHYAEEARRILGYLYSLPDQENAWKMSLKTHTHLDGTTEIFVDHGLCPKIAELDRLGKISWKIDRRELVRGALDAEFKVIEKIEKDMKSPQELKGMSIADIRKVVENMPDFADGYWADLELTVGMLLYDANMDRFTTMEERLESADIKRFAEIGEYAIKISRRQSKEIDRDEPTLESINQ